ncbi:hypothetical protein F4819DRAFT_217324 [Hypoxylon fuscum]|nr:hypothetical protein F4819DRAFT_217324 [Hypoxylon fuscum]
MWRIRIWRLLISSGPTAALGSALLSKTTVFMRLVKEDHVPENPSPLLSEITWLPTKLSASSVVLLAPSPYVAFPPQSRVACDSMLS